MIKVCHIASGDLWAGAEVMLFNLLKSLDEYSDMRVSLVLLNKGRLWEEANNLGWNVYLFDENEMPFFRLLYYVGATLRAQKPDIVHTHRYKENILARFSLGRASNVKTLTTRHGMPEVRYGHNSLKSRFVWTANLFLMKYLFDRVVGVSRDIKHHFVGDYGLREEKVEVIYNGVYLPERVEKKSHNGLFVIGSAGRFSPVKDYSLMVEIAKVVTSQCDNIRFKLAGEGLQEEALKALAGRYGLNDVFEFTGHLNNMASFFQELDVYMNTSIHEGISMSVLEAMSFQLPVIAFNVGGFKEIVDHQVDGILIEERSPERFAQAILQLYENQNLYSGMAKAAREKIEKKFSVSHMVLNYYNLYSAMLMAS